MRQFIFTPYARKLSRLAKARAKKREKKQAITEKFLPWSIYIISLEITIKICANVRGSICIFL